MLTKNRITEKFNSAIIEVLEKNNELTCVVDREKLYEVLEFLKTDAELNYNFLIDLTAVDYSKIDAILEAQNYARFALVYHLNSSKTNERLRIKAFVHEKNLEVRSVTSLWKSANWLERETFDMFGITFGEHPGLERILMPDDFEDYPLRKDYPLRGRNERSSFEFEREISE